MTPPFGCRRGRSRHLYGKRYHPNQRFNRSRHRIRVHNRLYGLEMKGITEPRTVKWSTGSSTNWTAAEAGIIGQYRRIMIPKSEITGADS